MNKSETTKFLDLLEKYVKVIQDKHTPSKQKMEARNDLQTFLESLDGNE